MNINTVQSIKPIISVDRLTKSESELKNLGAIYNSDNNTYELNGFIYFEYGNDYLALDQYEVAVASLIPKELPTEPPTEEPTELPTDESGDIIYIPDCDWINNPEWKKKRVSHNDIDVLVQPYFDKSNNSDTDHYVYYSRSLGPTEPPTEIPDDRIVRYNGENAIISPYFDHSFDSNEDHNIYYGPEDSGWNDDNFDTIVDGRLLIKVGNELRDILQVGESKLTDILELRNIPISLRNAKLYIEYLGLDVIGNISIIGDDIISTAIIDNNLKLVVNDINNVRQLGNPSIDDINFLMDQINKINDLFDEASNLTREPIDSIELIPYGNISDYVSFKTLVNSLGSIVKEDDLVQLTISLRRSSEDLVDVYWKNEAVTYNDFPLLIETKRTPRFSKLIWKDKEISYNGYHITRGNAQEVTYSTFISVNDSIRKLGTDFLVDINAESLSLYPLSPLTSEYLIRSCKKLSIK